MRVTNHTIWHDPKCADRVSIPYMRVTNAVPLAADLLLRGFQSPICGSQTFFSTSASCFFQCCFNPLYAGHKPGKLYCGKCKSHMGFNPLYAGHKPSTHLSLPPQLQRFNPLYAGHKRRLSFVLPAGPSSVSIPYMRVTNAVLIPEGTRVTEFQSPICGSQTGYRDPDPLGHRSFNPLYAGHKLIAILGDAMIGWCFNPLYAGHKRLCFNLGTCKHYCGFNPLYAGHKRRVQIPARPASYCFNPLYAGHKQGTPWTYWAMLTCFNPLYAGHKPFTYKASAAWEPSFNPLYAGHKRP